MWINQIKYNGVVGNVLVLTAVIQRPQLRRSVNVFIASLSVTDLIFSVTVMPFYVDAYIHRRWRLANKQVQRRRQLIPKVTSLFSKAANSLRHLLVACVCFQPITE